MEDTGYRAIAIVGVGAILPDAPNVAAFWQNVKSGRYSISEVTSDRWDPAVYYDPDPTAPDKTYSKIGGWVREYEWEPMKWRLAIPPRVADSMDGGQKWAIACTREALADYGYPNRPLDHDRTAVILGNAMAGERHYLTSLRIYFPEFTRELSESSSFAGLPVEVRTAITRDLRVRVGERFPEITEDTMPGELANCIAGRIANIFNFHGPNFVTDAACASAMAAIHAATEGLVANDFDVAITGGIDRNMGANSFVKFCKIGALSGTGTRPYAEGADGFVMGEGAAIFVMKRLADAEREGDRIYAVVRGIGASSDGKGKGITAPNPVGQKFAIERAWQNAGMSPGTVTLMEGHGTSTRVGDVVEVQSMSDVLSDCHLRPGAVALGSVKSNIGHLKGAAGAAGILKTILALRDKVLPPSVHCERPNPDIDFTRCPLYVNGELRPWTAVADGVRRAGVSAFGFGGTNFHAVLEEYVPGRLRGNGKKSVAVGTVPGRTPESKVPLQGALVIGANTPSGVAERLRGVLQAAEQGRAPVPAPPTEADLRAAHRLAIDYTSAADLAAKSAKALKALAADQAATWKALRGQGIYRGQGPAAKVAFLYTGQGSQYVNMLRALRATEPIVAETFAEADRVMTPILGKPLSEFIFVDASDARAVERAEEDLRQTAITQPAVLAADAALTRLLAAYGIRPDMTMGHSLGEYGALVASGGLPFADALEAVAARGREMTRVSMADNGKMAAVFAPLEEIDRLLRTVDGYVVIANLNSYGQAVIGGASQAVEKAVAAFQKAGYDARELPVSHAFHTSIVAPASEPLKRVLARLRLESPRVPIVSNVDGDFYPTGPDAAARMLDILGRQIASPVQFVKGLHTLYDAGVRVFVEVGPKKALQGFAEDVVGPRGDVVTMFTNHPKFGDVTALNQALCGLYAAGLGAGNAMPAAAAQHVVTPPANVEHGRYEELGRLFEGVLDRGWQILHGETHAPQPVPRVDPVAISGASLGLPGTERIFDDSNVARILRGDQFIDVIPSRFRRAMLDKHITRLVKTDNGGPTFETIQNVGDVIKLAGRGGAFDLESEFGVSADRRAALDRVTCLAMAAGIDALRDAGIPLVLRYKTTTKGTQLPDRWGLPDCMRDDTGVIFASVFPAYDSLVQDVTNYCEDHGRREQLAGLESLRARMAEGNGHIGATDEIDRRIAELRAAIEKNAYVFDRRFIFRILSMGHSQFAEYIGARGPNTQINAACATTTQAVGMAQDWIRTGRCRRVIVISADDITSDRLLEWFGAAFLASGAAATDESVEDAAVPFDRRRHGMIMGMGAAALVVESAGAARERGVRPICEVLAAAVANSAFHGTRLDVEHICGVMEGLVKQAETQSGVSRHEMAGKMVFVSHETYTPARGGSAAAEIHALRRVFGESADRIVIANTKGFTGHAMGTGIEDVVAVKALETGCVPPVANFKEIDPELGALNLSKGGVYPIEYALRLGAGFGSQISMTLLRWAASKEGVRPGPGALGYAQRIADEDTWNSWLGRVSGRPTAELEVVKRTLRVRDGGAVVEAPVPMEVPVAVAVPPADPVKERVLALVSKTTGYPIDMLGVDMDLEADLGVDTVKQAEVFAAIREAYGIGRDDRVRLRDFPTLAHVIRFVHERSGVKVESPLADARGSEVAAGDSVSERGVKVEAPLAGPRGSEAATGDSVTERVLGLVVEKTGYPRDMLDLDLDLEADLGIDTVKQAELLAAIREAYGIARDDRVRLRDFPTLAHVIRFVHERSGVKVEAPPVDAHGSEAAAGDSVTERVLGLVVEKTGYPRDMLDLDLDLEADLGIDTVKQAELLAAIREAYGIARDDGVRLRDFPTLAHVIRFVHERTGVTAAAPLADAHGSEAATGDSVTERGVTAAAPLADAHGSEAAPGDSVTERVLGLVVEKTGYPRDMLDLDLDLEADLGIDTVKQAELLAAIREAYGIARDDGVRLRDFPTLAHVIRFVHERSGATAAAEDTGFPRRTPVSRVRPPLAACKETGVRLGAGSRVAILRDRGGVGDALAQQLEALGVEVIGIEEALAGGSVQGVYWLPALDRESSLAEMELADWREALDVRVKSLYRTMRALYGSFLVSATRLGGQHGYDEPGAVAPLGGAVVGFTKAYKREKMEAFVKSVDFEPDCEAPEIARLLMAETLRDPGAIEVGYQGGQRYSVGLAEWPTNASVPALSLNANTVFAISGAAGSIVSAITADLARASGGTFYLLDLAPEPDPANPDLRRFAEDREGLKRDLFARIQARGERATPALVEKELAALERAQAAQSAIDAVRRAGGRAHYFSVDITDAEAVAKAMAQVRERSGRIDVLLHAAGVERSHFLPDKEPREFDMVFDVKSDGWFNLLHAIGDMPLGATVAFSSVAGRFGNAGQTDYSAANDLLCKITSSFRTTRPGTRGLAIDWTAWGGIGMATRGSIPKMMEMAGIEMLPPEVGVPLIRKELTGTGLRGELVVARRLGVLLQPWDESDGLDLAALEGAVHGPMAGKIAWQDGLTIETTLDPAKEAFLYDHQIDGVPVLPGVMGIEAFAEAAKAVFPGWDVEGVEDVEFLAPFKFYRKEPRTVTVEAAFRAEGGTLVAECRLMGRRVLANAETQETTHFTGRVRLTKQMSAQSLVDAHGPDGTATIGVGAAEIYRVYFHGPAYQVVEQARWDGERVVGTLAQGLPANHDPADLPLTMEPRWIELCFQTAGLWELATEGRMGLPLHVDRVRVWPGAAAEEKLFAVVTPRGESFDAEVVNAAGRVYATLEGYRTVAMPDTVEAAKLDALHGLVAEVAHV